MHRSSRILTLPLAVICHGSEVMRMQDGWTKVLCAAAVLVVSFGMLLLCIASARYLERAKSPDDIDLGFHFSVSTKSFWLGLRGSKRKPTSEKGPTATNDNLLS